MQKIFCRIPPCVVVNDCSRVSTPTQVQLTTSENSLIVLLCPFKNASILNLFCVFWSLVVLVLFHRLLIKIFIRWFAREWRSIAGAKKNTSRGNEVLPQDTTHLIQRPRYQRGSLSQDPTGNWATRRPPDHRKQMQTEVMWTCFPFIRSGQNYFARHSEKGKETR